MESKQLFCCPSDRWLNISKKITKFHERLFNLDPDLTFICHISSYRNIMIVYGKGTSRNNNLQKSFVCQDYFKFHRDVQEVIGWPLSNTYAVVKFAAFYFRTEFALNVLLVAKVSPKIFSVPSVILCAVCKTGVYDICTSWERTNWKFQFGMYLKWKIIFTMMYDIIDAGS